MDSGWKHGEISPNCPRCGSSNTKFCYYNNYSLSQPRYFCKGCRRYWTKGGSLRNVPVGGGCRKHRRGKAAALRVSPVSTANLGVAKDSASYGSYLLSAENCSSSSGGSSGSPIDVAAVYAKFLTQHPENGDNDKKEMAVVEAGPGLEIADLCNNQLDPPPSLSFPGLQLPEESGVLGCIPPDLSRNDGMYYLGLDASSITKQNCEGEKLHGFGGGLPPLPGEEVLWSDSHPESMLNNAATQEPNHHLFGNWSPFVLSSNHNSDTFSGST